VLSLNLSWFIRGGSTEIESCNFMPIDVQLSIDELAYKNGIVSYIIKNEGKAIAEKVQVKYTNISEDVEGQTVELNGQQASYTTTELTIGAESSAPIVALPINFKQADEATFKFEILYKGIPIEQKSKKVRCEAKKVKLKLVPVDSSSNSISLVGDKQEFKCKIAVEDDSRAIESINTKYLELSITNTDVISNASLIAKTPVATTGISKLTDLELEKLGEAMVFYVILNKENEANFKLNLFYKGVLQENPLTVSCKAIQPSLLFDFVEGKKNIENDEEITFSIKNIGEEIDLSDIILRCKPTNNSQFKLDGQVVKEIPLKKFSYTADNLLGNGKNTKPIKLQLADACGNNESKIKLELKRLEESLNKATIKWRSKEIKLAFVGLESAKTKKIRGELTIVGTEKLQFQIQNEKDQVNTDEIIICLESTNGVPFTLNGKLVTAEGIPLIQLLGENTKILNQNDTTDTITLQLHGPVNEAVQFSSINLSLKYKNRSWNASYRIIWIPARYTISFQGLPTHPLDYNQVYTFKIKNEGSTIAKNQFALELIGGSSVVNTYINDNLRFFTTNSNHKPDNIIDVGSQVDLIQLLPPGQDKILPNQEIEVKLTQSEHISKWRSVPASSISLAVKPRGVSPFSFEPTFPVSMKYRDRNSALEIKLDKNELKGTDNQVRLTLKNNSQIKFDPTKEDYVYFIKISRISGEQGYIQEIHHPYIDADSSEDNLQQSGKYYRIPSFPSLDPHSEKGRSLTILSGNLKETVSYEFQLFCYQKKYSELPPISIAEPIQVTWDPADV